MPENRENRIEKKWYSRMFSDMFLAEAAGRIKSALIIRIPTHLMESMTITAMQTAKRFSISFTRIPRLAARERLMLMEFSWLEHRIQKINVPMSRRTR